MIQKGLVTHSPHWVEDDFHDCRLILKDSKSLCEDLLDLLVLEIRDYWTYKGVIYFDKTKPRFLQYVLLIKYIIFLMKFLVKLLMLLIYIYECV